MKKVLVVLSLLLLTFAFSACEKPNDDDKKDNDKTEEREDDKNDKNDEDEEKDDDKKSDRPQLDVEEATLGEIIDEIDKYAKEKYENAGMIGFNNHNNSFAADYTMPENPSPNGESDFWVVFYVKDVDTAFENELLDFEDGEVFGIQFYEGELKEVNVEGSLLNDVSADQKTGKEVWLGIDTDLMISDTIAEIAREFPEEADREYEHVEFTCTPDWLKTKNVGECILNLFDETDDPDYQEGFEVRIDPANGTVEYIQQVYYEPFF